MATATCRPESSRADRPAVTRSFLLALGLAAGGGVLAAPSLQLELGRLAHPAFTIDGLRIELGAEGGPARLAIGRLAVGERSWENLSLHCSDFRLAGGELRCRRGKLRAPGLPGQAAVEADLDPNRRTGRLTLVTPTGERIRAEATPDGRMRVAFSAVGVSHLVHWVPAFAGWQASGRFDGVAEYAPGGRVTLAGRLADSGFASEDGLRAAEGLALELDLAATPRGEGWRWQGRVAWSAGEAYLHPLYLTAGPVLAAAGSVDGGVLAVERATLSLEGVRSIAANGRYDLSEGRLVRAALAVSDADLAVVGPRYLAPILMPARADALQFAGRMSAGIELEGDAPVALDAAFDGAAGGLASGALAFGPVSGRLAWRADAPTEARLSVGGGHWQKLALGPFELAARLHGERVAVDRLEIPVLDGALVLDRVELARGPRGWSGTGGVVVEPISMRRLTEAVDLPAMSGALAASLPGLRVAPGEIALDGALVISIFDGYVQATRLRVLEPFGVAAHAFADVEARHLDLAQLTDTFSFGSVTGYIDADVRSLELARWRPVRFDAWVASSAGRYKKRISQRAVENISALGGAGAVAALQRTFLGVFETFGYREVGLSCVLDDGVCLMSGLADATGGGFYIVRGGGIPALNVIGYNRRVDWNELVDRLQRVISSNTAPVVQ